MGDPLGVVGTVLSGKFRVERLLGEGGFGVVYAGTHLVLGTPIAVKLMKVDTATTGGARAIDEYLREARILFSLAHPAIVRMYDVGTLERPSGVLPWVVLELLSGPTLEEEIARRRFERRPMTLAELGALFDPILDGLAFAHARGVIHRDLKPSNVLLARGPTGAFEPKILDFGTARATAGDPFGSGKTGFTPLYGAPEQWDPAIGPPSPATDVYSAALAFLEAATLARPHGAEESLAGLMRAVMSGAGIPRLAAARPDLPIGLDAVFVRATQTRPEHRYRDAGELRAAIAAARGALSPGAWTAPTTTASGVHYPAMPSPPGTSTTASVVSPSVTSPQGRSTGSGLLIGLAIGVVALVALAGLGAAGAAMYLAHDRAGPTTTIIVPPAHGSAAPTATVTAPRGLTKPVLSDTDEIDLPKTSTAVVGKQPTVEACWTKSDKFRGAIAVTVGLDGRGNVKSVACRSPQRPRGAPDLDPAATGFCGCLQGEVGKWTLPPPRAQVPDFFGEEIASFVITWQSNP